jgi:hypothetical protein
MVIPLVHPAGLGPALGTGLVRTAYRAAVLHYTTGVNLTSVRDGARKVANIVDDSRGSAPERVGVEKYPPTRPTSNPRLTGRLRGPPGMMYAAH